MYLQDHNPGLLHQVPEQKQTEKKYCYILSEHSTVVACNVKLKWIALQSVCHKRYDFNTVN